MVAALDGETPGYHRHESGHDRMAALLDGVIRLPRTAAGSTRACGGFQLRRRSAPAQVNVVGRALAA